MTFKDSLHYISKPMFFEMVGYSYRGCGMYSDRSFEELPKDFQDGLVILIHDLYNIQKMVYSYELELVCIYLQKSGVMIKPFLMSCGINKTFHRTLSLSRNREERLIVVRLHLIRMLNRLFDYVNRSQRVPSRTRRVS